MRRPFLAVLCSLVPATYAFPDTLYVDASAVGPVHDGSSWCAAYRHLQDALAAAAASGGIVNEIRVADGIYRPDQGTSQTPGDRAATFLLLDGVTIAGGYPGCGAADPDERDIALFETILSGDLAGNDVEVSVEDLLSEPTRSENSYHVVTSTGLNAAATLGGFSITDGNADQSLSPHNVGGGMYNVNSSSTVTDCIFRANSANHYGGGMYNLSSSPTVTDCTFSENSARLAGGGMYNTSSSPMVAGCTFSGNSSADGGGMYTTSSPTITGCTFSGNSADDGGGMYVFHGDPTVTNCSFISNSAGRGGGMRNRKSTLKVTNCTFGWNSARFGGGMLNWDSNTTVTNCTFSGNSALREGGGIYESDGRLTVTNCVFWGDGPAEIYNAQYPYASLIAVSYSNIEGGRTGTGNIDSDPMFVDAVAGDLRLRSESPCIDSGNNDAVPAGVDTDRSGAPRFTDHACATDTGNGSAPIADMGAYEFQDQASCGNGVCDAGESCETCNCDCGGCCGDGFCADYEGCVSCLDDCACETIHVPEDYARIQDAIDAAHTGDEIVVAPGTYYEAINFLGKAIVLRSSLGREVTTIDASGLGTSVVRCVFGEGADTSLDGFTLTGGNATHGGGMYNAYSSPTVTSCAFIANSASELGGGMYNYHSGPTVTECMFSVNSAGSGGGMFNQFSDPTVSYCTFTSNSATSIGNSANRSGGGMYNQSSGPTITTCTFTENSADSNGGGMYNSGSRGNATVFDCTFTENTASSGGGMYNSSGRGFTVIDCQFSHNSADESGGGMYNRSSSLTVTGCGFTRNWAKGGGGIFNDQGSPTVINCSISGNSATGTHSAGGGMYNSQSSPAVTNCTFSGNSAGSGGGMFDFSASPTVTSCTFSGNTASSSGGAIYTNNGDAMITNSVFWGDVPSEVHNNESQMWVLYSNLAGWAFPILGNIDSDPLFVRPPDPGLDGEWGTEDDDYGDLRLRVGSPCVDAGDPAYIAEPGAVDLDGRPRVLCDRVDMGAYEFAGDYDCNYRLDLGDVAGLQSCFTGEENGPLLSGCRTIDFDGDDDIDLHDFAAFERAFLP